MFLEKNREVNNMNNTREVIFNTGRDSILTQEEILYGDNGITIYLSKCISYFIPYTSILIIINRADV